MAVKGCCKCIEVCFCDYNPIVSCLCDVVAELFICTTQLALMWAARPGQKTQ